MSGEPRPGLPPPKTPDTLGPRPILFVHIEDVVSLYRSAPWRAFFDSRWMTVAARSPKRPASRLMIVGPVLCTIHDKRGRVGSMSHHGPKVRLQGRCSCESVTFEFDCLCLESYVACNCGLCRKAAGWVTVPKVIDAVPGSLYVEGLDRVASFKLPPSSQALLAAKNHRERTRDVELEEHPIRCFCAVCGSQLWLGRRDGVGEVSVFVTSLNTLR